jgi:hypothetical protein
MSRISFRRPSAALSISILALIVAVAGGGQAIAETTATIAKQISGSTIKKGTVTGKQIKSGTITSKQVKNDTLTGKQIKESTLGTVPSATTAGSASSAATADNVGGTFVRPFNFKSTLANSGKTTVFEHAGYRVQAECVSSKPSLKVTNVNAGASELINWRSFATGAPTVDTTYAFNPGVTIDAINPTEPHGASTIQAAGVNGSVLTGQIVFDNDSSFGGSFGGCFVAGTLSAN